MSNHPLTGADKRDSDRQAHKAGIKITVRSLFKRAIDPHSSQLTDHGSLENLTTNLEEVIKIKYEGHQKDYHFALTCLSSVISKYNRQNECHIPPPNTPLRIFEERSHRTRSWCRETAVMTEIFINWSKWLDKQCYTDLPPTEQAFSLAMSLVFHSGVANDEQIIDYLRAVKAERVQWKSSPAGLWAEFPTGSNGKSPEEESTTQLFIDPISCLLSKIITIDSVINKNWLINLLTTHFPEHNPNYRHSLIDRPHKKPLKTILLHAYAVWEWRCRSPHVFTATSQKKIRQTPLQASSYLRYFNNRPDPVTDLPGCNYKTDRVSSTNKNIIRKCNKTFSISLKSILDRCRKNATSPTERTEKLQKILDTGLQKPEHMITSWFIKLSSEKLNKTDYRKNSTLIRYANTILDRWLSYTSNYDLSDMESDDWEDLLEKIHSDIWNYKKEKEFIHTIESFALFAEDKLKMPPCPDWLSERSTGYSVNAHLINDYEYYACLSSIINLNFNENQTAALYLSCVLGYRCALRIGEANKILLNDVIIDGNEVFLWIRRNRFYNNKNRYSKRRIHLSSLLSIDELQYFLNIYKRQSITHANKKASPLFNTHGALDILVDRVWISTTLGKILRAVTGEGKIVFHSLRHSCLNRILWILITPELAKTITDYSEEKIEIIRDTFLGDSTYAKKNALYAIAAFAGHQSPQTTCRNYLHTFDMLMGFYSLSGDYFFTDSFLNKLSVSIPRTAAKIISLTADSSEKLPASVCLPIIESHLKITCNTNLTTRKQNDYTLPIDVSSYNKSPIQILGNIPTITRKWQAGASFSRISREHGMDVNLVASIINAAKELAELKTQKGTPRLFSSTDNDRERPVITPTIGREQSVLKSADKTITRLLSAYDKNPNESADCIYILLNNTTTARSEITLDYSPGMKLLPWLIRSVGKTNLHFTLKIKSKNGELTGVTAELVKLGIEDNTELSFSSKRRKSTLSFRVKHPYPPESNSFCGSGKTHEKMYSSRHLVYAAHTFAIYMIAIRD